ncbi:hypothetical protein L3V43_22045 [Pseudoalteromonas sp. L23]|uniref:hypothetical protein n=1 Tax=unclassified Pseudoalteromonas TaxID=194690 RepID=UPI001EF1609D|nr:MULTISPECIES: hypothetical protein [unclassified Pseudoalteromonas]MCF7516315.1 hypothetical protein [Pseudoalteromonas sp. L7]MCF7528337.1 hypothetical protein [Pseudoalteromonas sp. L23]MCX2769057.1 hypothetical protein [Pseudoalteromonas sp. B530]
MDIKKLLFVLLLGSFQVKAQMSVKQFSWSPSVIDVGESTTFYWSVEGAKYCQAYPHSSGNTSPRATSGRSGPHRYTSAGAHTTHWFCEDYQGNRVDLRATRVVREPLPPRPSYSPVASPAASYQPVNQSLTISWGAVSGATSYRLYQDGTYIYGGSGRSTVVKLSNYGHRYYSVEACNQGGCASRSQAIPVFFYTTPGAVSNLTGSVNTAKVGAKVQLNWGHAGGEVPGVVYAVIANGREVQRSSAMSASVDVTLVGNNNFEVVACNPQGTGCGTSKRHTVIGTMDPPSSSPQVSFNAGYQPVNQPITVRWGTITGADRYRLYEDDVLVYQGSGSNKSISHNNYGRRFYSVEACNQGGCAPRSQALPIFFYTTPGAVSNLTGSVNTAKVGAKVQLNWGHAGGEVPGVVYAVIANGREVQRSSAMTASVDVTLVGNNNFEVVACNPQGTGCGTSKRHSVIGTIDPPSTSPQVTFNVGYQPVNQPIAVRWNAVTGADRYRLYEDDVLVYQGSGSSKSISHNNYGRRFYSVEACNQGGCAPRSQALPIFFYTTPGSVSNFAGSASSARVGSQVQLTWGPAGGEVPGVVYVVFADGKEVQRSSARSALVTVSRVGKNIYEVVACNPEGTGCGTSQQFVVYGMDVVPVEKRFEWSKTRFDLGEVGTFYWDIEGVHSCRAIKEGVPEENWRGPKGDNGRHQFVESRSYPTQWECFVDEAKTQRFPANPSEYLTADLVVSNKLVNPVILQGETSMTISHLITDAELSYAIVEKATSCNAASVTWKKYIAAIAIDTISTKPKLCAKAVFNQQYTSFAEKVFLPSAKKLIFIHTDLLGSPVAESENP